MTTPSRESLFAIFAAVLGVSAACNHDGDAPPVTAREVASFSDASIPSATIVPPTVDAAVALAPRAAPDVTPDASTAATSVPDAGVVAIGDPPAPPDAAKLAWLLPVTGAPTAKPPAPPAKPPTPPRTIGDVGLNPGGNCGGRAACGASTKVVPRTATVQLRVAARPGLATSDAETTTKAIAMARARITGCFRNAIAQDPRIESMRIVVRATAPGNGTRATFFLTGVAIASPTATPCIVYALGLSFGGDDKPTSAEIIVDVAVSGT